MRGQMRTDRTLQCSMGSVTNSARAIVGLRPSFSSHVRWGERGAPVDFLRVELLSYSDRAGPRKLPAGMWRGSVVLVQGCVAHLGIGVMLFAG
jgi:hypothetical protein